jgi:hypothetical protein
MTRQRNKNDPLDLHLLTDTGTDSPRKHGPKVYCPNAKGCLFDDCPCHTPHYKTPQCARDHRDECPTCKPVTEPEKRHKRMYIRQSKKRDSLC